MFGMCLSVIAILMLGAGFSAAGKHAVGQKGRLFQPQLLNIASGDEVVFKNDDTVSHHIYSSTQGHHFNLKVTDPGGNVSHTFTKGGQVEVRCGVHPAMRLVVNVK